MKFSIIIPVYNVVLYLRECLDSVLAQTCTDWEAICVDDGSTDGSGQILDEYAAKDGRFIVIHQKNAGVSAARNAALSKLRGELVAFVDADDVVSTTWLETTCRWIDKTSADILRFNFQTFTKRIPTSCNEPVKIVGEYENKRDVLLWGVGKLLANGHLCRGIYKRFIVEGLRFPVGVRMMEDCAFQMWMLVRAEHVTEIDYCGYFYRQRAGSAIHSLPKDAVADKLLYFAELRRWFQANRVSFEKLDVLDSVGFELGRAVFHSMVDAVVQYRVMRGRYGEYDRLAALLREMLKDGSFSFDSVPWSWRLPMKLFIGRNSFLSVLLRWKIEAARSKFMALWR